MIQYAAIRRPAGAPVQPDREPSPARISRINHSSREAYRDQGFPRPAMRIALYEPDIPQNTGTILRLCACLGLEAHIIEPAGFPVTDRAFRRAGMDYLDQVALTRHRSFEAFEEWRAHERLSLILLSTTGERSYLDHVYGTDQVLLFGRESAGVPGSVHKAAGARLRIPMQPGMRSLNVAIAAAIVASEALRQTNAFPR